MTMAALGVAPMDGLYPLNRSEQTYLALDGLAGSVVQPYLMRLDSALDEGHVRQSLRDLVSAYPRLRGVVEPGLHFYRLRVLPDDHIVDQLFDVAWRVEQGLDADDPVQMQRLHNQLLNEVLPLERGLGLRVRFVPHAHRPVLIVCVHHLLLDGRSMMLAIKDVLRRLNGHPIAAQPMEAPSMVPSIAPRRWHDWPAKLWASWKHQRAQQRLLSQVTIAQLPSHASHHYSANAVAHHVLLTPADAIKRAARRCKTTVNTFLLAAVADSFLELQADDPKAAAVIRLSVDMRRFYPRQTMPRLGNCVASFLVAERGRGDPTLRMASLDAQIKEGLGRFIRREMCWNYLLEETFSWFGRTLYAHLAHRARQRHRLPQVSCHMSSLGDVSDLNEPGAPVRLIEFFPTSPSLGLLVGSAELRGRLFLTCSWQLSDTDRIVVQAFIARLDRTVAKLVAQSPAH